MNKENTQQIPRQTTQQLPKTMVVRQTRRAVFALVGGALMALGLLLIPLPGPGWLTIILGLTILSWEFIWAKRMLVAVRTKIKKMKPGKGRRHAR